MSREIPVYSPAIMEPPEKRKPMTFTKEWLELQEKRLASYPEPRKFEYYIGHEYIRYDVVNRVREQRIIDENGGYRWVGYWGEVFSRTRPWYARWVSKSVQDKEWEKMRGYQRKGTNG